MDQLTIGCIVILSHSFLADFSFVKCIYLLNRWITSAVGQYKIGTLNYKKSKITLTLKQSIAKMHNILIS